MGLLKFLAPLFGRTAQMGAMALICAFPQQTLEAKDYIGFLFEGERLFMGDFLRSEDGRFQMGFTDAGELEIVDLKPKPKSKSFVEGWDGKTYWEARFTPNWGFKRRRMNPHLNLPPVERRCDPFAWRGTDPWKQANCHGDLMYKHKAIDDLPSYKVRGGTYLSLLELCPDLNIKPQNKTRGLRIMKRVFMPKSQKTVDNHLWSPWVGYPIDEVVLYLENCGRAIIFNTKRIFWCSCPHCDDWGDGIRGLSLDFYNFEKNKTQKTDINLLEIPTHKTAAARNKAVSNAAAAAEPTEERKTNQINDCGDYQALFQRAMAVKAERAATVAK